MDKAPKTHPLLNCDRIVREQGIVVFDDIHEIPAYNEPYMAPYTTVTLNLTGWVRLEYDMHAVCFEEHDIAVVHANHTIRAHASSDDYHAILMAISPKMEEKLRALTPSLYVNFNHYILQPHFQLTHEQQVNAVRMLLLIKSVSEGEMRERETVLLGLLHIMAVLLQNYRLANGGDKPVSSPRMEFFNRFHEAIVKNFRKNRDVKFYADLFCLTPKYFSTTVKHLTGTSAREWIHNYVMIQARTMLRHHRHISVQQIAFELGFPDLATFSRFFKINEGITPTEFREGREPAGQGTPSED